MSLPGTLAYAAPQTTQAAQAFRFPARPSCPRINSPGNDSTFLPGDLVTVTIETNRDDLDHTIELIDAAGGAVVGGPTTIPAGSTSGSLSIPSLPNESKEFYVRVYVAAGGHFEHRVLINTRVELTVVVTTVAGPMAGTHVAPQTVTLEAQPAGGAPPYIYQWRQNGVGIGGATGQQLTTTMTAPGEYRFTVNVTESGFGDEVESDEVVYTIAPPFEIASFRRDPAGDVPAGTLVTFFATFAGGLTPYHYRLVVDGEDINDSTSSTAEVTIGTHTFNFEGTFTGELTAEDHLGQDDSEPVSVTVTP